jgi:hypothetical protein
MIKARSRKHRKAGRPLFTVGCRAKIRFGSSNLPVIIVEDRGAIGSMGRHLVRVRPVGNVDENSESFEVPADELLFASGLRGKLSK